MPFSRTTAKRVPAGTTMNGPGAATGAGAVGVGRAGGGETCGPSGCCAETDSDVKAKVATARQSLRVGLEEEFMGNSVIVCGMQGLCHTDARATTGMAAEPLIIRRTHPPCGFCTRM